MTSKISFGYRGVQTSIISSAPISSGGAVAVGVGLNGVDDEHRIMGFGSDGSSTWTLGFTLEYINTVSLIAADATGYSVFGVLYAAGDLDPGPGTHVFGTDGADSFFVSR